MGAPEDRVRIGALAGILRRPPGAATPGAAPAGALVLLHGRGADEHDLAPLFDVLDPQGRWVRVTLRGPLSLPPGGAHWYVVREIGYPDPSTFFSTFRVLAGALDELPEMTGVPWERTVVGGFSMGAVMAYAVGLAAGRPEPAGILALSGFVPAVEGFELDLEARKGLPVFIAHGTRDLVIGVEFGRRARDLLGKAGLAVRYKEEPTGHYVAPGTVLHARAWLVGLPAARRKQEGDASHA